MFHCLDICFISLLVYLFHIMYFENVAIFPVKRCIDMVINPVSVACRDKLLPIALCRPSCVWHFLESSTNLRRLLEKIKYVSGKKCSTKFLFIMDYLLLFLLPVSLAQRSSAVMYPEIFWR